MSEKLSQNLNLLMAEARINAEALSRHISLPASTIKKVRNNNDSNPTLSTLTPLANYFSLTISQLIGDEPFDEEHMYLKPVTQRYNISIFTAEHCLLGVVVEYKKHLKTAAKNKRL